MLKLGFQLLLGIKSTVSDRTSLTVDVFGPLISLTKALWGLPRASTVAWQLFF